VSAAAPLSAQEIVGGQTIYRDARPDIWQGDVGSGPLVHRESLASFPEKMGEFKRDRIMAVNNGNDVMLQYKRERSEGAVTVSIFLFQRGSLPEHLLGGSIDSLAYNRGGQFVWSDGPFNLEKPRKLRLFKGTYKQGIGPDTVMDYLYFGELGKWTVKVRATLPSTKALEDEQGIDALVKDLPWEAILSANGDCTGTACNDSRSMPFNHHIGEMLLTNIANSGKGKKKEDAPPPLFSRKEGSRIWEVHPLIDPFAGLFRESYGGITVSAPLYTLSWEEKKKSGIVRFFTGKPDETLFNKTVDGLEKRPETDAFTPSSAASLYLTGAE
jgi:hypothetical protein